MIFVINNICTPEDVPHPRLRPPINAVIRGLPKTRKLQAVPKRAIKRPSVPMDQMCVAPINLPAIPEAVAMEISEPLEPFAPKGPATTERMSFPQWDLMTPEQRMKLGHQAKKRPPNKRTAKEKRACTYVRHRARKKATNVCFNLDSPSPSLPYRVFRIPCRRSVGEGEAGEVENDKRNLSYMCKCGLTGEGEGKTKKEQRGGASVT